MDEHDEEVGAMERITSFSVGSDVQQNTPLRWYGRLNDFQIWDKEFTAADVQNIMYTDVTSSHPMWNHLVLSFPFQEGNGWQTADGSQKHNDGFLAGACAWTRVAGDELVKNATLTRHRPCVGFVRSGSVTHVDSTIVIEAVTNPVTNM